MKTQKIKPFKSGDEKLDKQVNSLVDGLYGQSLVIVSWMNLVGEFVSGLSAEEQKTVKQYLFPVIDQLEDELDEEILEIENKFIEKGGSFLEPELPRKMSESETPLDYNPFDDMIDDVEDDQIIS